MLCHIWADSEDILLTVKSLDSSQSVSSDLNVPRFSLCDKRRHCDSYLNCTAGAQFRQLSYLLFALTGVEENTDPQPVRDRNS